jgi:meso-butanediol dehydrogenase/(S,S)-butanediol dehydrogenase/diacetyl reductase
MEEQSMEKSQFSLEGKIALVTGGGRGIGAGIAASLAGAGADVIIADYTLELAEAGAAEVTALGRRSAAIQVDVRKPESIGSLLDTIEAEFGRLDIAMNNAGVVSLGGIEDLTLDQWDDVIDINLRGVFLCCQAEIKLMRKAGYGRIINTSSIAGKTGFPNLSHYSASKFGVIGFTNAIAKEVAKDGITVNALCPGIVGTGMWRGDTGLSKLWAAPGETEEQSWARHQQLFLPQGVAQTPEDMGQMVVYLASAAHVTGQALAVDGGFSL